MTKTTETYLTELAQLCAASDPGDRDQRFMRDRLSVLATEARAILGGDSARAFVAADAPVQERAPEIGRLLHTIRTEHEHAGSWNGGDVTSLLCEWFIALGYDIASPLPGERDEAGATLLCDDHYRAATGLEPECQDYCSLALTHDGVCADRHWRSDPAARCERCGKRGRLTEVDPADLDDDGPLTCERCGARVHNLSADGQCITCIAGGQS